MHPLNPWHHRVAKQIRPDAQRRRRAHGRRDHVRSCLGDEQARKSAWLAQRTLERAAQRPAAMPTRSAEACSLSKCTAGGSQQLRAWCRPSISGCYRLAPVAVRGELRHGGQDRSNGVEAGHQAILRLNRQQTDGVAKAR